MENIRDGRPSNKKRKYDPIKGFEDEELSPLVKKVKK